MTLTTNAISRTSCLRMVGLLMGVSLLITECPADDAGKAVAKKPAAKTMRPAVQTGTPRKILAGDYRKKRVAIVNAKNKVVWEHPIQAIHDAHLLDNGNILFQTSFRNVMEMTPKGEIVWKYEVERPNEIHAFQRLDDGITMVAESGTARIIELDAKNKVVKEIKLKVNNPHPHRDTRLVRKLKNGHYLAAQEGDAAVREYDENGKVVWDYNAGVKVYSAIRLDNGNTLIGTGDGHRVIEVTPKKEIVWSVEEDELPGIKLVWVTMVDRMKNGNTLIVNCHAGPENPQMIEVTPKKKVVWTFLDFKRFGNALPVGVVLGK